MRPRAARAVCDGAQEGVVLPNGAWAALAVEHLPDMELDDYLDQVSGALEFAAGASAFERRARRDVRHGDLAAREVDVRVNIVLAELHAVIRVYRIGEYCFRVEARGPRGQASQDELVALLGAFHVLPGAVQARRGGPQQDGVFESAAAELRVTPSGPWRHPQPADELTIGRFDDLGLVADEPVARCTMRFRRGTSRRFTWPADEWEGLTPHGVMGYGVVTPATHAKIDLFEDRDDNRFRARSSFDIGETTVEFEASFETSSAGDVMRALTSAIESFGALSPAEADTLRARLAAQPDPDASFGGSHSLHEGVFADHALGLRVQKPKGLWSLTCGASATAYSEPCRLVARSLDSSLFAYLEVRSCEGATLEEMRVDSLVWQQTFFGSAEALPAAAAIQIAGRPALVTAMTPDGWEPETGSDGGAWRVVSLLVRDQYVELLLESDIEEAARLDPALEDWLRGIELDEHEQPIVAIYPDRFVDRQLGITLSAPGREWHRSPKEIPRTRERQHSSGFAWRDEDGREIAVTALGFERPTNLHASADQIVDGMRESMMGSLTREQRLLWDTPTESWSGKVFDGWCTIFVIYRNRRVIIASVRGPSEEDPVASIEAHLQVQGS